MCPHEAHSPAGGKAGVCHPALLPPPAPLSVSAAVGRLCQLAGPQASQGQMSKNNKLAKHRAQSADGQFGFVSNNLDSSFAKEVTNHTRWDFFTP